MEMEAAKDVLNGLRKLKKEELRLFQALVEACKDPSAESCGLSSEEATKYGLADNEVIRNMVLYSKQVQGLIDPPPQEETTSPRRRFARRFTG